MAATATQRLVAATVVSICMSYAAPLLLTKCPKGMNPAPRVMAASTTSGRVIARGDSWGVCSACRVRFSRPQKMP